MSAIAMEVGFPSSQQLATSFKDVTSMTPSEFQARSRGLTGRPPRPQVPMAAERTT
jgi:AraC-like DNA-binding protein